MGQKAGEIKDRRNSTEHQDRAAGPAVAFAGGDRGRADAGGPHEGNGDETGHE